MVFLLKMSFLLSFLNDTLGHYTEVRVLSFVLSKDDPGMFLKPWLINLVKFGVNISARVLAGGSLKFPVSTKCVEGNCLLEH